MRSFRFLLSRRWVIFAAAIVIVAWATWWLGEWQFHRLDDRRQTNEIVRANEDHPPAPVEELLAPGEGVDGQDEWRLVTATGEYAVEDTVIVRYRTRDGAAGVDVVVPLVTAEGPALLVDRGWMQTDNRGATPEDVPAPPPGEVTVTGWVRADGTGDSTAVAEQSTRAVSSDRIGEALGREVYGGWVELRSEDPPPTESLQPVELPELDEGPHFFYGLQWWFFGVLAVGGFLYLAYDEWRGGTGRQRRQAAKAARAAKVQRRKEAYARAQAEKPAPGAGHSDRSMPPSTGTIAPDTNDDAGESRNATTRPNSSGLP